MNKPVLELTNIHKYFGPVKALKNVELRLYPGEVMALVGENGAGKSTIVNCIAGVFKPTKGQIKLNNKTIEFKNVQDSINAGISVVHQELKLVNDLTVAENIFLNREFKTKLGKINWKKMYTEAEVILKRLKVNIKSNDLIRDLPLGKQQMVEIAKALSLKSKIILFDEPTDALTQLETKELFRIIDELKASKVAILYISHRLEEINQITDKVSIFRDGVFILEEKTKKLTQEKIIKGMIGRSLKQHYPEKFKMNTTKVLEVKGLKGNGVKDFTFDAYAGEIVGISGLMGSGRTEAIEMLISYTKKEGGKIFLDGAEVNYKNPHEALKAGVCYLTEDRKEKGVFLDWSIKDNITIANIERVMKKNKINLKEEFDVAEEFASLVNVKTLTIEEKVKNLSGGNQQKVSIAKSLFTNPSVFFVDEPTRGVDVGAKKEIYNILFKLKKQKVCIILISSDLPELLGISDRILVANNGKIVKELKGINATKENVMEYSIK